MANETKPGDDGPLPSASDAGSDPEVGREGPKSERDFGDSAGYGSGGSTLDHREVGDAGASGTAGKHNPLDDIMNVGDADGENAADRSS